jgi:hypothetical protein
MANTFGLKESDLRGAIADNDIDQVYSQVKGDKAAFTAQFKKMVGRQTSLNEFNQNTAGVTIVNDEMLQSVVASQNRKRIIANLPENIRREFNLVLAHKTKYDTDNAELATLQDAYKARLKDLKLEGKNYNDLSPDTQKKLNDVYLPFSNKQKLMISRKKAIGSARQNVLNFIQTTFGIGDAKTWFKNVGFSENIWKGPNSGEIRSWGQYAMGGMVAPKSGGTYSTSAVQVFLADSANAFLDSPTVGIAILR